MLIYKDVYTHILPVTETDNPHRGVARNLFQRGTKPGDLGQKSPAGSRGRALVGVWELPQKLKIYVHAKNHCNNVLTKTHNFFQHGNFRGGGDGGMSSSPPSLRF